MAVSSTAMTRAGRVCDQFLNRLLFPRTALRIVVAAGGDLYPAVAVVGAKRAVAAAMVAGDAPRPPAGKIAAQRFGLADTLKWMAPYVMQSCIDPTRDATQPPSWQTHSRSAARARRDRSASAANAPSHLSPCRA